MTALALIACVAAGGFAALAWTQRREAQRRSAARVATLAAAIDGPLESFAAEGPSVGPARRGWIMAAGVVPIVLIVSALLVTRGPR